MVCLATDIDNEVNELWVLKCFRDRVELGDLTQHNIKQLKLLNQVILPVTYNDKFYKDVLDVGDLAKLGKLDSSWIAYYEVWL